MVIFQIKDQKWFISELMTVVVNFQIKDSSVIYVFPNKGGSFVVPNREQW